MGHKPSSSPTDLRRTRRVMSLTVIAVVESAKRTLFNPKIKALLSCMVGGISHGSSNKDHKIKHKADVVTMPWVICPLFTRCGEGRAGSEIGFEYEIFAGREKYN